MSAGEGSKGARLYEWAVVELYRYQPREQDRAFSHWLLVRRSLSSPAQLGYYVVFAPREAGVQEMVRVAGTRWRIESSFQVAKDQLGLDQYEVRRYDAWYRHITLSLLAMAVLCVIQQKANGQPRALEKKGAQAHSHSTCYR